MSSNSNCVLVAYASKRGSTRGVAERIASVLRECGHEVEIEPVEQVVDVSGWRAVVLGSPVYDGSWLPEAAELVRRNLDRLGALPLWLFSVGSFGDQHRVVGGLMKKEPREMAHFLRALKPRDYRVFAGVIAAESWPLYGKLLLWLFGSRSGDNRDWRSIEAWAATIAEALLAHNQDAREALRARGASDRVRAARDHGC
jgi:menaquinone-dependent protoporphyrinogen oxidase